MTILEQYLKSRYAAPDARSTAPATTVDRTQSNLTLATPSGSVPSTYEQTVLQEKTTLRFTPRLSGAGYDSYVRIEQSSFGAAPLPPVFAVDYMVTENNDFLMTENNDNLILQ
jgi:hypothetical protein